MKKIFAIVTILVTLAACTKTEQNTATTTSPKTITLKAGISNDATKMAFSEDAETGISSTFEKDDVIYVFDASGNMTEFTVESVDGDGVATFTGTPETPIAEDDPITAVVKNSGTSVSGTKVSLNLNSQTGTLESAGKHALIEKPFAPTAAEAREVFALAKEKGLVCMPNQNRRFDADFLAVKEVLAGGRLGQLVRLESHYDYFKSNGWYDHLGTLYNLGVHTTDQIISLLGRE